MKYVVQRPQVAQRAPKKSKNKMSFGAKVGALLGHGAQTLIKHVTGFGDYQISGNTLMGKDVPIVQNTPGNGTIVRHREYIQDISPSFFFNLQSFIINPGNPELFPWLSALASNYEEYRFKGLIFEYKPMSASAFLGTAGNVGLGTVVMATQYNVLFPNFPDKRTMENYEFACSAKPNETFIHPVECAKAQTVLEHQYVQAAGTSITGDARFYHLGNFQLATQGFDTAATGIVGELWASYEVELYKPKLTLPLGITNLTAHFQSTSGSIVTTSAPFPTGSVLTTGSTCNCLIDTANIYFPTNCQGVFLITVHWDYTSSATGFTGLSVIYANCIEVNLFHSDSTSQTGTAATMSSTDQFVVRLQLEPANSSTMTFSATGVPTTGITNFDVIITQIAYNIN